MKLNYLDLFSGIGGFRLGFERAGFKFGKTYHSDIEDYPNKIYKQWWPESVNLGNIEKVNPEDLGKIDIISAGFPCQDISTAGKQKGFKDEHGNKTRSGLFHEIIRLCRVCRPKVVLLENVANLLAHNGGRTFSTVLFELAEIGYDAEWEIISAKDVGARHLRKRIWIVAYPNGERLQGWAQVGDIKKSGERRNELSARCSECEKWSYWKTEPSVGRVANGVSKRTHRIKALGNAVVPQVVQLIGENIIKSGLLSNIER